MDIFIAHDGFALEHARTNTLLHIKVCPAFLAWVLNANSLIVSTLLPPYNPLSPKAQVFQALVSTLYDKDLINSPTPFSFRWT